MASIRTTLQDIFRRIKTAWRRRAPHWWPAALTAATLLAAWLLLGPPVGAPAPASAAPEARIESWAVRFAEAPGAEDDGAPAPVRTVPLGQPMYLLGGQRLAVWPQPRTALGSLRAVPTPAGDPTPWQTAGGAFREMPAGDDAPAAPVYAFVVPNQPGRYTYAWMPDGADAPTRYLELVVVAQATHREVKGGTQVEVLERDVGLYPAPEQSTSEKVRQFADRYRPPTLFALLDERTAALPLGENLRMGDIVAFIDRYDASGKKVITDKKHIDVLPPCPDLYRKLNLLRQRLRGQGIAVTKFWITSGFRAPAYNKRIGGAAYSRHCYGDAVDLCIDEDGDLRMDDLNGDGRQDREDGLIVARAAMALEKEGLVTPGGIGVYEYDGEYSVRSHVHVDCRGYPARWGITYRGGKKRAFEWWPKEDGIEAETSD